MIVPLKLARFVLAKNETGDVDDDGLCLIVRQTSRWGKRESYLEHSAEKSEELFIFHITILAGQIFTEDSQ